MSFQAPYTKEEGTFGYNEICEMLADTQNSHEEPWKVVWNDFQKAPYMYKGDKWVSYDDQRSIRIKTNYAYKHNLAGVIVSAVDTDDFQGNCGGGKYPLLRTINKAFYVQEKETINKK